MKQLTNILPLIGCIIIFGMIGCASSKGGSGSNTDDYQGTSVVEVDNPSITLADYLRRVSGVQVNGNGPSAKIIIRGTESFKLSSDPLFVLDGVKVGRDFARVSSLVNMTEVKEIRVLKGIEASVGYGIEGGNGVIEIITKNS